MMSTLCGLISLSFKKTNLQFVDIKGHAADEKQMVTQLAVSRKKSNSFILPKNLLQSHIIQETPSSNHKTDIKQQNRRKQNKSRGKYQKNSNTFCSCHKQHHTPTRIAQSYKHSLFLFGGATPFCPSL